MIAVQTTERVVLAAFSKNNKDENFIRLTDQIVLAVHG